MENLVIVGSGPAGLTAALYAARAGIGPLVIEGAQSGGIAGGQLMNAGVIENFPALPKGLDGPELVRLMREQVREYRLQTIASDVVSANLMARPFTLTCANGKNVEAKAVIVATGAAARRLPMESEKKFWGRGVSACAVCDGALPLFRDKPLAVIGGGDSAAESALHLTQFGIKIAVIHRRDRLKASKVMQQRVLENKKIDVFWNKTVVEFLGDEVLTGLRLKDEKTGETSDIAASGAFEAIGEVPNNKFLGSQIRLEDSGHIRTQSNSTMTSVDGVFAAGDIADRKYRQAITASGSGCMAALDAERWLIEKGLLD
ncbi:MAG TPA: thioredoxin-disulfide reductase [Chitinivibrionales bacterium]|nr:thioredoxin-disulfide reductase [Chitinivibrionales bacterium]